MPLLYLARANISQALETITVAFKRELDSSLNAHTTYRLQQNNRNRQSLLLQILQFASKALCAINTLATILRPHSICIFKLRQNIISSYTCIKFRHEHPIALIITAIIVVGGRT